MIVDWTLLCLLVLLSQIEISMIFDWFLVLEPLEFQILCVFSWIIAILPSSACKWKQLRTQSIQRQSSFNCQCCFQMVKISIHLLSYLLLPFEFLVAKRSFLVLFIRWWSQWLYNKYKDKRSTDFNKHVSFSSTQLASQPWCCCSVAGLEILAFPCNQEEPGTTDPITDFVCTRFKSEFPIFHKVQTARQILYKFYVLWEVLKQQNLPPLCFRLKWTERMPLLFNKLVLKERQMRGRDSVELC